MEQASYQYSETGPSLLRQIVDEVDAFDEVEKAELLRIIKLQNIVELGRRVL